MSAETHDNEELEPEAEVSAFAVRMSGDHQVVGIFVAVDVDQLADLVDQCCDPSETEYLPLGVGGVYVGSPTTAQWPSRTIRDDSGEIIDIETDDQDALKGASLDDYWWHAIHHGDWLPLVWDRTLPKRVTRRRLKATR